MGSNSLRVPTDSGLSILPIDDALPALRAALCASTEAVVVAPPGAGKTTRIPLALLDEPWVAGRRIVLLEPRRLAARAAAERMAATLGETPGGRVGLRIRFDTALSARTRIDVVTEGVFTRMIGEDPTLDGIAAVLFDEFHERSLEADLGLALALDARALRPDLRLIVMSATLDGARVASLLGNAPVIESQGRMFPVQTRYLGRDPSERIEDAMARAVLRALNEETGSVLAFLPGQGEIARTAERLDASRLPAAVDIAPLYAALDRRAQDAAIEPSSAGRRKVVLASAVAESSLTIAGIRIVVDSGLARVPVFEPALGLTRLETQRESKASADQRRGRAGRTEPGICYRLWDEAGTGAMRPHRAPVILAADLSGLILDCAAWGVAHPEHDLGWLDVPPAAALKEARAMLRSIGALEPDGRLTDLGRKIRALALPPRLARMVVLAVKRGQGLLAARLAVLVVERGLGGDAVDARVRLRRFDRDGSLRAREARSLARTIAAQAGAATLDAPGIEEEEAAGSLLSLAYPDRIAKGRGKAGEFLMVNGRAAALPAHEALAGEPFLVIADAVGRAEAPRILLAAPLAEQDIAVIGGEAVSDEVALRFDPTRKALAARRIRKLGAVILGETNLPVPATIEAAEALAAGIAALGLESLPWTPTLRQWRDRVAFLRAAGDTAWPDLSDHALTANGSPWLAPHLLGLASLADITATMLETALAATLPWRLAARLDDEAPAQFTTPAGATHRIDYAGEAGPTLSVKVQEVFGLARHPTLAGGRIPLVLELLSPAGRPVQVTRDLPGFWHGSWSAVRSEMRGRYPKHVWPERPAEAAPTLRAKPRG